MARLRSCGIAPGTPTSYMCPTFTCMEADGERDRGIERVRVCVGGWVGRREKDAETLVCARLKREKCRCTKSGEQIHT
jgi:hypothetical protein